MTEMNEPDLRLRAVVPAPLKVVYEALTDPAALRVWLAEHAEVDLPGKYEFWGRYTPDGAQPHQRVLHVDERTIRFAWTLDGVETTSQIEVAEDEDGTLVTLSQTDLPSFEDVIADRAGARGNLHTFWSLAIANLADYLEGRALTPCATSRRASCARRSSSTRRRTRCSTRWSSLRCSASGSAPTSTSSPWEGGRFAMGGFDVDPGGAKFVEFEQGRKAALLFADGETTSWELEGSDGKTRFTLMHSGFDPANPPYPGWAAGWAASPGCGATSSCRASARSGARSRSQASPRACWPSSDGTSAPGPVPGRSSDATELKRTWTTVGHLTATLVVVENPSTSRPRSIPVPNSPAPAGPIAATIAFPDRQLHDHAVRRGV
jgi:uncharacterized protein YndB with AHSA1/START domain